MVLAEAGGLLCASPSDERTDAMCGIFGYVGSRRDAAEIVLRGLKRLEYRGYDSWGIAVPTAARAVVEKRVGKIGAAATSLPESSLGLGHTRWATHGGVTEENAHPHVDCGGRFAVVHNGIVSNERDLRQALIESGHRVRSETDTELVAHLVEDMIAEAVEGAVDDERAGPGALGRALMAVFRRLRGLNAVAVLDAQTGVMVAATSGSSLVVGSGVSGHFITSDHAALIEHTRRVTFVRDGQVVLVSPGGVRLFDRESEQELAPDAVVVPWEAASAERLGHPDYMTKEIHEQPAVLRRLSTGPHQGVRALAGAIRESREVFAVGCGSGAHAAIVAQYLFARTGKRVAAVTGSEFAVVAPFVDSNALVLALSQSGETIDVLEAVRAARARGARVAAVTNVEGSTLWREADLTVPLEAGPERCVLSTKSLTAKLAILILTAAALEDRLPAACEAIDRAAADIDRMLQGERRATIRAIAAAIRAREHLFVIGRGTSFPLALETALKIKEVSYIHAEGFAGGELKHGVLALVERGTPCVVLAPDDDALADVMASAMQARARGAILIGVSPRPNGAFDHHIEVADVGDATPIVNAVPGQLLGYDLARLRGHDPDMPRNLAKSVTVK
jgi:glutamine---fructose-6-phosphate transaminase (isomerizing)